MHKHGRLLENFLPALGSHLDLSLRAVGCLRDEVKFAFHEDSICSWPLLPSVSAAGSVARSSH